MKLLNITIEKYRHFLIVGNDCDIAIENQNIEIVSFSMKEMVDLSIAM